MSVYVEKKKKTGSIACIRGFRSMEEKYQIEKQHRDRETSREREREREIIERDILY